MDAGAELGLGGPDISKTVHEMVFAVREVVRPAVGEQSLEPGADSLVRVELQGIGRHVFNMQPLSLLLELSHEPPAVGDAVVPHHDEGAGYLSEELPDEALDVWRADVLMREMVRQAGRGLCGDGIPILRQNL